MNAPAPDISATVSFGVATSINLNGAYRVTRVPTWEGRIESETDGRNFTTRYAYDAVGRLLGVTPPGTSLPTVYDYRPAGRPDGEAVLLTKGAYWRLSELDGNGRAIAISDSEGIHLQTAFDPMNNVSFQSYPSTQSRVSGDAMAYDGLGRVRSVARGFRPALPASDCGHDGVCYTSYDYFSDCTKTTVQRRPDFAPETWRCNSSFGDPREGRLAGVADANGGIWRYSHNTAGNLTAVTAPAPGGNRSFTYYPTQFLETESTAESGTVHYARNGIGQMTGRTDARGVTATYGHEDPLSRLTSVQWRTVDDVTRRYEASNLKHVESPASGAVDYDYDEINRVIASNWVYRGVSYTSGYHYDPMGCLDTMTYPTGTVLTMTCDGLNRVTSVSIRRAGGPLDPIVSEVRYHPSGQPELQVFGNDVTTDLTYDDHARLSTLTAARGSGGTVQAIAGLSYGYDGAGNVVAFDNSAQIGAARTMGYDALDRLEWVFAPQQWGYASYSYDALGNLTARSGSSGTTTYVYDPKTNRLSYTTGVAPKPVGLTWDAPGHVVASSDQATYRYDPAERRIEKLEATGATVYHYDVAGRVIAETRPDGTKLRDYVYLGNKLIAVDGCVTSDAGPCTERQWYHTDALGSVLARTDESGTIVAQFDYDAFGARWNAAGLVAGVDGDRQYNGRVYDAGSGFHDYGARLYWPEIGRFVSADSYLGDPGNPASLNRYSYTLNNPYKYIDPTGHYSVMPSIWGPEGGPLQWGAGWLATKMAAVSLDESQNMAVRAGAAVLGTVASLFDAETTEKTGAVMGMAGSIRPVGGKSTGFLVRFGRGPETAEELAEQAARAEANGFPHGVSTKLVDRVSGSDKSHRSASKSEVEEAFTVEQTGKNPAHHTVHLPKPVTPETADTFNKTFPPK